MDQISSAIDKCFSSLITDTDVKNVNDRKEEFNKFKNTGTLLVINMKIGNILH